MIDCRLVVSSHFSIHTLMPPLSNRRPVVTTSPQVQYKPNGKNIHGNRESFSRSASNVSFSPSKAAKQASRTEEPVSSPRRDNVDLSSEFPKV